MGSLKDEMRGLREDHKPCEKTDDGERPGGSDGSAEPQGPQINTSQESATHQPKLHMNASSVEERGENETSEDQALSEGGCVKDSTQADAFSLAQQPEDDETATAHNDTTVNKFQSDGDGDGDGDIQGETSNDHDREKEEAIEIPGPSDPRSPAPAGQQHMRTQVSLEVVQCRSAATSPMTPPEGGHSFFFPSSFGKPGAVGTDTKDAELQVGQQVEFCSVATSPMTPKTPSTTAFPELIGRETVQKSEARRESGQQGSFPTSTSLEEAESQRTGALKLTTSNEPSEDFSSNTSPGKSCTAAGLIVSQVTVEDSNQQCKQQRMGSMDQDITILVTQYGNNEEEEDEKAESSLYPIETEMAKIDECEELRENSSDGKDGKENIPTETVARDVQDTSNTNPPQESSVSACSEPTTEAENSEVKENKGACGALRDVTKPPVPESPAPFGCHNIRTQVSLEVVQCQSVATSPMTPPEGDHAFYFPSSLGKCGGVGTETKDAELQVGQQVEFCSVATAPMTPRTPTVTAFPEIRKDTSIEEKIVEEEEDRKGKEEDVTKEKMVEEAKEDTKEAINCQEKCEEPVQEVSWDEKGMTWEVYGAVVEVAVLGSAIQKHLEKQVKKQKPPSMPPPPPLNPSAKPLSSESTQGGSGSGSGSGSGKGRPRKRGERDGEVSRRRRNPFRLLMENMQQPHCCSRAHTAE